uniref:uncharacterized protein LOC122609065 n=1 Tax=Erigeron canadensis TaxID=72917 RepID=UPI001CB9B362|nr:uncharacterized protein LOC122609065 [Erigeron canadensis]
MSITVHNSLKDRVIGAQVEANKKENVDREGLGGVIEQFTRRDDGGLYFCDRLWIPLYGGLRKLIMDEAHKAGYSVHPGIDTMYQDLRDLFWWPGMKNDVTVYVSKCLTCLKVKAEHKKLGGLLTQPELPTYHPQSDGQSQRTIHTLEDMLRAYVIDFGGSWDTYLPLVEFSYNNSYHASIGCPPYEVLYGRKCRSSLAWHRVGDMQLIGPEIILETTKRVAPIKENLLKARDRQKK